MYFDNFYGSNIWLSIHFIMVLEKDSVKTLTNSKSKIGQLLEHTTLHFCTDK